MWVLLQRGSNHREIAMRRFDEEAGSEAATYWLGFPPCSGDAGPGSAQQIE
jgi:hypothetical protein